MIFCAWQCGKFRKKMCVCPSSVLPSSRQPYKPLHERQPVCKPRPIDHTQILTTAQGYDGRRRHTQVRRHAEIAAGLQNRLTDPLVEIKYGAPPNIFNVS